MLEIIATRGKMQNPVTGSGGMLIGTVEEVGPASPLGLTAGRPGRHAGVADADPAGHHRRPGRLGRPQRAGAGDGHAILFGRSIAAVLPDDLRPELALAVLDVCGAPALTARVVRRYRRPASPVTVAVIGGAGKSGSLSLAAAAAGRRPYRRRGARGGGAATRCAAAGLADEVALADARDPVALSPR